MSAQPAAEEEPTSRQETESLVLADTNGRRRSDWLVAGLLIVTFSVAEGITGSVAGLVTVGVWFGLGTPYALAAGTVFLTAQTSDGVATISVLLVGGGLLALILAPIGAVSEPTVYGGVVFVTTAVLSALTWLLAATQPIWLVATVLLGTGMLVMYGLHRYQRLQLGLLDDGQSAEETAEPTSETETP